MTACGPQPSGVARREAGKMRVQAMATGRVVEAGAHHYREVRRSTVVGVEPTHARAKLFLACIEDGSFARISRCRNSRLEHARQDACAGSITVVPT